MDKITETATIMVVDDSPENLNLLGDMLKRESYRVLSFPNGRMALDAAVKDPPDLILLDIMMAEMDGFEVCKHLKADDVLKDIPVLFISALTEVTDKIKAFSTGGVDYVTKPFHFEEVNARVETHLHLRQMKRELEKYNLHLEELVNEQVKDISDSQLATLLAVSKMAEYRDDETGHHVERTRTFCRIIAEQLRTNPHYENSISDDYVENIFHAAPLHDIGKVGIADSILLKPGKLTVEEFEIMKNHSMIGANTLQSVRNKYPKNAFVNTGIAIARSHHEKWDGSGYPDGLAGEDIPLAGRIMALADVYDALRAKRPYKPAFSHEKSCRIILEGAGQHFDPAVIEVFKAVESEFAEIRQRMADGAE
ncbi:MAG: response regulator [Desulfamplus sp.]|nr:response regulator [Desulfamplus sp.]